MNRARPGHADHGMEARHRVAGLLPDLAEGGLLRRLAALDGAGEYRPALGEEGPRRPLGLVVGLDRVPGAQVDQEAALAVHENDADAPYAGERQGYGQDAQGEHPLQRQRGGSRAGRWEAYPSGAQFRV